jgi:dTDP-4-dehydrorhamnose reductase
MRTKIIVTGSSSLVGSHFVESFGKKYDIIALGRTNLFNRRGLLKRFVPVDLLAQEKLERAIKSSDAELVINFAAQTNVDKCEIEKDDYKGRVYLTNTAAVRTIAKACKRSGKALYQISTDAVFDGVRGPYSEHAKTGPMNGALSWYGQTKYLAEGEISGELSDYCVVRISYPYRSAFAGKTDFARRILDLFKRGALFPLFFDQLITPTLVDDVSSALDFLVGKHGRGKYHVASRNITTPFEFGSYLIASYLHGSHSAQQPTKQSIRDAESLGRAPRPIRGGLKTDKVARKGFVPLTFQQGIRAFLGQMGHHTN